MAKASKKKRAKKGTKKKKSKKKKSKKKTKKSSKKSSRAKKHSTKTVKVDKALIDNFVGLQKVMVNLSSKFDSLSTQISKLLELFEISAKSLAQKDFEKDRKDKEAKEILKKLDNISQQAGLIGKGLVLIHEASSGKGFDARKSKEKEDRYGGMTPSMSMMKHSMPPQGKGMGGSGMPPKSPSQGKSSTREIGGGMSQRGPEGEMQSMGKTSGQTREISETPGQQKSGMSQSQPGSLDQGMNKRGQKPFIPSTGSPQNKGQSSMQSQGPPQQRQEQGQQNQMGGSQTGMNQGSNQMDKMQSQEQGSQQNPFSQQQSQQGQGQEGMQNSQNKENQQQSQEQTPQ